MRKEFPSQTENRKQWIIDMVRNNQVDVWMILQGLTGCHEEIYHEAHKTVWAMHRHDRDALLQPGGVLTNEQIEILHPGRLSSNTEADQ